ncbi:HipA N-terminal domain-containing protein [Desulfovibrio sp. OttesenSCG-928-C14]|nr:HipA N-terminal domain-containing protein [Desulfovibrio sp. OttesenSCG-928-C14]
MGGETVGHISPHRRGNVTFSYAEEWLAKYNQPISLSLPCSAESFAAQKSTAFFDNLLPEEAIYKDLCREARLDEADIYNFLRLFGQECAGALTVFEEGAPPSVHSAAYRDIRLWERSVPVYNPVRLWRSISLLRSWKNGRRKTTSAANKSTLPGKSPCDYGDIVVTENNSKYWLNVKLMGSTYVLKRIKSL